MRTLNWNMKLRLESYGISPPHPSMNTGFYHIPEGRHPKEGNAKTLLGFHVMERGKQNDGTPSYLEEYPIAKCVTSHCLCSSAVWPVPPTCVAWTEEWQEEASPAWNCTFLHFRHCGTLGNQLPWCWPLSLPFGVAWPSCIMGMPSQMWVLPGACARVAGPRGSTGSTCESSCPVLAETV